MHYHITSHKQKKIIQIHHINSLEIIIIDDIYFNRWSFVENSLEITIILIDTHRSTNSR